MSHIVDIFPNISYPTISHSKFLTRSVLHSILNSLLAPTTASESQASDCDIKISLDMLWIGVTDSDIKISLDMLWIGVK